MKENQWLLRLVIGVPGEQPWVIKPLEHLNLLIKAGTEDEARKLANKYDEDKHRGDVESLAGVKSPWLSKEHSTCVRVG